jgi:very-short-patch-repair endonuclease
MKRRLETMAMAQSGVFSAADAARVGVSGDELTTLVRHREIVRVRRAAYVLADAYADAQPSERYLLRVKAILRSRDSGDRASHHSALAVLGIGTVGTSWDVVAIESKGISRPRVRAGLAKHPWSGGDTWSTREHSTVAPATACVQVAVADGFEPGVCAMDSALRLGLCTIADLREAVAASLPPLRRTLAQRAVSCCDPRAESVGESRTRIILTDAGFDVRAQVDLADERGFIGRVDFLVDECVVVEFDGLQKYAGAEGHTALTAEKAREERLTRLGYEVVRIIWSDLADPVAVVRRVAQARQVALQRRAAVRSPRR